MLILRDLVRLQIPVRLERLVEYVNFIFILAKRIDCLATLHRTLVQLVFKLQNVLSPLLTDPGQASNFTFPSSSDLVLPELILLKILAHSTNHAPQEDHLLTSSNFGAQLFALLKLAHLLLHTCEGLRSSIDPLDHFLNVLGQLFALQTFLFVQLPQCLVLLNFNVAPGAVRPTMILLLLSRFVKLLTNIIQSPLLQFVRRNSPVVQLKEIILLLLDHRQTNVDKLVRTVS